MLNVAEDCMQEWKELAPGGPPLAGLPEDLVEPLVEPSNGLALLLNPSVSDGWNRESSHG